MSRLFDLRSLGARLNAAETVTVSGRVVRASGITVEATLPEVAVGTAVDIQTQSGALLPAEVIGFEGARAVLMPFGDVTGVGDGSAVFPKEGGARIPVGEGFLGRVLDPSMRPMDNGPAVDGVSTYPLVSPPPSAMGRQRIDKPLCLGIKAIDACLTCGEGQRLGILAGPGVGKSVLLGMLARGAQADVIVVGLIGERGREVREFVERDLGPGISRSVLVVATADAPPLVRVRAAMAATAVAEFFRDQGKKVLLLVDSLTRVAMAQREVGLAAGEPPTSKGYPPSVFAVLPKLVERAGNGVESGSITAMYTILAEGDDLADPVADAARAALDGHIVLSRKLANAGHFPAIDILGSVSRVMNDVVDEHHVAVARAAREVLSVYAESADLVEVGAYVEGSNARLDKALKVIEPLRRFFQQTVGESFDMETTLKALTATVSRGSPEGLHVLRSYVVWVLIVLGLLSFVGLGRAVDACHFVSVAFASDVQNHEAKERNDGNVGARDADTGEAPAVAPERTDDVHVKADVVSKEKPGRSHRQNSHTMAAGASLGKATERSSKALKEDPKSRQRHGSNDHRKTIIGKQSVQVGDRHWTRPRKKIRAPQRESSEDPASLSLNALDKELSASPIGKEKSVFTSRTETSRGGAGCPGEGSR